VEGGEEVEEKQQKMEEGGEVGEKQWKVDFWKVKPPVVGSFMKMDGWGKISWGW
jgi:hypothetical protein